MSKSVDGIFRNGKVELTEPVLGIKDETKVIVTFVETEYIDLQKRGISKEAAIRARARLASFAEDWESPEMDVYDDYDNAKHRL